MMLRAAAFGGHTVGREAKKGYNKSSTLNSAKKLSKIKTLRLAKSNGVKLDSDAGEDRDNFTLGLLPSENERKKVAHVSKLCQTEWQSRFLVLTDDDIIIALPASEEISDKIPLDEVKSVTRTQENPNDILSDTFEGNAFNIHTVEGGYNCGRGYCFRVNSEDQCNEWISIIAKRSKVAQRRAANRTRIESYRARARKMTSSSVWQQTNSFLIVANIVVIIAQSQTLTLADANGNQTNAFEILDIIFTSVAVHLFAYWFWNFFTDWWFMFDFAVVAISVASLLFQNLPGVTILRLMRTFRVLRLFNKLRSLRTLINALASALLPLLNAFVLMILLWIVYSILGVELFGEDHPEEFGSFALSYWTMFEITTLDSWTEKARILSQAKSQTDVDPVVACFMCSFIGCFTLDRTLKFLTIPVWKMTCWVMLPVLWRGTVHQHPNLEETCILPLAYELQSAVPFCLVAVLLDNFNKAVTAEKLKVLAEQEETKMAMQGVSKTDAGNPLDPVLENLSRFRDSEDLSRRIYKLFQVLDVDLGGTLDFQEIREGLRKMEQLEPPVHLSPDDYRRITRDGAFCDESGELDPAAFEAVLRTELLTYVNSRVSMALDESLIGGGGGSALEGPAVLTALKWILMFFTRPAETSVFQLPSMSALSTQDAHDAAAQGLHILGKTERGSDITGAGIRASLEAGISLGLGGPHRASNSNGEFKSPRDKADNSLNHQITEGPLVASMPKDSSACTAVNSVLSESDQHSKKPDEAPEDSDVRQPVPTRTASKRPLISLRAAGSGRAALFGLVGTAATSSMPLPAVQVAGGHATASRMAGGSFSTCDSDSLLPEIRCLRAEISRVQADIVALRGELCADRHSPFICRHSSESNLKLRDQQPALTAACTCISSPDSATTALNGGQDDLGTAGMQEYSEPAHTQEPIGGGGVANFETESNGLHVGLRPTPSKGCESERSACVPVEAVSMIYAPDSDCVQTEPPEHQLNQSALACASRSEHCRGDAQHSELHDSDLASILLGHSRGEAAGSDHGVEIVGRRRRSQSPPGLPDASCDWEAEANTQAPKIQELELGTTPSVTRGMPAWLQPDAPHLERPISESTVRPAACHSADPKRLEAGHPAPRALQNQTALAVSTQPSAGFSRVADRGSVDGVGDGDEGGSGHRPALQSTCAARPRTGYVAELCVSGNSGPSTAEQRVAGTVIASVVLCSWLGPGPLLEPQVSDF